MQQILNFFKKNFIKIPLHPLLFATFSLAAGIGFQSWLETSWLFIGLIIIFGAIAITIHTKKILLLLYFTVFVFGSALYQKQLSTRNNFFQKAPQSIITAIGTVIDKQTIIGSFRTQQLLTIQLKKIFIPNKTASKTTKTNYTKSNNWAPSNETVFFYVTYRASVLPGDTIAITRMNLKKTTNKSFDLYLAKEGAIGSTYLTKLPFILLKRPLYSWRRTIWQIKNNLLLHIQKKLQPSTFALFSSIFLGNKQLVKKEMNAMKEYYKNWGVSHYLARSGLHLVVFIAIWGLLLNFAPLSFCTKQLLLIALCSIYLAFSWTSISFMRAFFTFLICKSSALLHAPTHSIHILSLVAFFILALNPACLFFLDFQLSFIFSGALIWFGLITKTQTQHIILKY